MNLLTQLWTDRFLVLAGTSEVKLQFASFTSKIICLPTALAGLRVQNGYPEVAYRSKELVLIHSLPDNCMLFEGLTAVSDLAG